MSTTHGAAAGLLRALLLHTPATPAAGSYTSTAVFQEATKVFYVGENYEASAPASGRLWLNKNTDAYSNYTADNSGQVEATIEVSPPETEMEYTERAHFAAHSINALEPWQQATNFCVRGVFDHIKNALIEEALTIALPQLGKIIISSSFLQATIYEDLVRIDYEKENGQIGNVAWSFGGILFAGVDTGMGLAADALPWWSKESLGLKLVSIIGTRSAFNCAMAGLWFSGELGGQIGRLLREKLQPPSTVEASIAGAWTLERSAPITCINFPEGCLSTPISILVSDCTATQCTIARSDGVWQRAHTITRSGTTWSADFEDIGVACHDNLNVARIGLRFSVTTSEGNQAKSVGGFYTVQAASTPPDCADNGRARYPLSGSR